MPTATRHIWLLLGWKLWTTKARRSKNEPLRSQSLFFFCFSSGVVFLGLETNRRVCEREEEMPNNRREMTARFKTLLPALGGSAHPCSTHQPPPDLAHDHGHPRQGLAAVIICVPTHSMLLVWERYAEQTFLFGAIAPVTLRCTYSKYLPCQFKSPSLRCLINCESCLLLSIHECLNATL